jgi:hypothetical protein
MERADAWSIACGMGEILSFDAFAAEVRSHLWVLEIEPAFQLSAGVARFMWPPNIAELQFVDDRRVRVAFSQHGELLRTVEYAMDKATAKLVAEGITAVFEPET